MEIKASQLTSKEIEEKIKELEHIYAESFGNNAGVNELNRIQKKILELQKELRNRNNR
jgi:ribosome-interacting GTPase 1